MGLLATLFGKPATTAVSALGNAFDQLFTSDEERAQAQIVLTKIAQRPHILQAEINKIEAAHRSIFVAGWRPFIGWVCGLGILWAFIGHPVFEWVITLRNLDMAPPDINTDNLLELVLAMLGLGALRTAEKLTGRSK
ncbi:MAG: 3TM-type holin [Pseudomonadota bacterium]